MPGIPVEIRSLAQTDAWGPVLERGLDDGLRDAAAHIAEKTAESMAARRDPWGAFFAPLSPTTIKLYAQGVEDGARLATAFRVLRGERRKVVLRVSGSARRYAYVQQFGNPFNRVFGEGLGPIPARPPLPIRDGGGVDLPREMAEAVHEAVKRGVRRAVETDAGARIAQSSRQVRALRRR